MYILQRAQVHVLGVLRHICSFLAHSPSPELSIIACWKISRRRIYREYCKVREELYISNCSRNQSILFSCFEAWLIASAHDLGLPDTELSSILSRCTFINGIVAALSGVFSNAIVNHFGTVKAPFVSSATCLGLAALAIRTTWAENYGHDSEGGSSKGKAGDNKVVDEEARQPLVDGAGNGSPYKAGGGVIQAVLKGSCSPLQLK